MKKHLTMFVALLLVVAFAVPAFAAVEFKYGGEFRVRWMSQNNNMDGSDTGSASLGAATVGWTNNDNQNFIDQRARLYFTFIASENLKLVTKFEMGDTIWGKSAGTSGAGLGRVGAGGGGNVGADSVSVEVKNVYLEFNIPNTAVTATVGIQGINLLNSWVTDDDFSAAVLKAKLDPVTIKVGYIAGQNQLNNGSVPAQNNMGIVGGNPAFAAGDPGITVWQDNIDSFFLNVEYAAGPLKATLLGFYQGGHETAISADPSLMNTPFTNFIASGQNGVVAPFLDAQIGGLPGFGIYGDNNLFDLGLNLNYKLNWMSANLNFVKNLGSIEAYTVRSSVAPNFTRFSNVDIDYTGWMVDAAVNFFCGPYTFNLGGFYTTGNEVSAGLQDQQNAFVYPMSTAKVFSEIIGGGLLDSNGPAGLKLGHRTAAGVQDYQWTGYQFPSNIWTITAGAAWQVMETTKLSASYWYFGTSEDVVSGTTGGRNAIAGPGAGLTYANDLGHEFDMYLTQGLCDGLTLDLVAAYLITGDAYTANDIKDDAYKLGARLLWAF